MTMDWTLFFASLFAFAAVLAYRGYDRAFKAEETVSRYRTNVSEYLRWLAEDDATCLVLRNLYSSSDTESLWFEDGHYTTYELREKFRHYRRNAA